MEEAIYALNGYVNLYCKCLHRTALVEVKWKKKKFGLRQTGIPNRAAL
jgi:hypothetical protein